MLYISIYISEQFNLMNHVATILLPILDDYGFHQNTRRSQLFQSQLVYAVANTQKMMNCV